jgi:integrase
MTRSGRATVQQTPRRGLTTTTERSRGMAKTSAKERKRTRRLTDDEIRAVWRAAEADPGPYGALVRFLLLTAARRDEAAEMSRSEIVGTDWTIPANRYKTGVDHVIPLSTAAKAIVDARPMLSNGHFVFSGKVPIGSFTYWRALFDKACGVTGWTLHDLRRTALSLMSRAKVDPEIAGRCLGHVIGGAARPTTGTNTSMKSATPLKGWLR